MGRVHPYRLDFWGGALAGPLAGGRGLVLTLHMLGLLCMELRQQTMAVLGKDLLPVLVGSRRAMRLTVRSLDMQHSALLWRHASTLRRYTPSRLLVAVIIAVRRMAPLFFLVLAMVVEMARAGGRWRLAVALVFGLVLFSLTSLAVAREWRALPRSTLQRLPLLLPKGLAPCGRKFLGYAFVTVERVEKVRAGLWALLTLRRS